MTTLKLEVVQLVLRDDIYKKTMVKLYYQLIKSVGDGNFDNIFKETHSIT